MIRSGTFIWCFTILSLGGCGKSENAASPSRSAVQSVETSPRASATVPKPDPITTLAQLEEQVRSSSLSPQKREEIQQLLSQAKAALARKDFATAEKLIQDALALDSTNMALGRLQHELRSARQADADAAAVTQAEAKKKQDAESAEKKERYAKLMREGKEALSAEEFEKASKLFADAAKLNPDDNDAPLLQGMADKQKVAAEKEAEAAKKAEQEEEKRKQEEAEAEKKRAQAEADTKKKGEEELRRKLSVDVEARKRADQLKEINQQPFRAAIQEGQKALAEKRFDDAVKALEKALQLFPDDSQARSLLKDAKDGRGKLLKEWLAQGNEAQRQKKWLEALALYQQILSSQPGDQAAKNGANVCEFQMHLEAARAALARQDKSTAVKRLEAAAKLFPKDEEVQRLLQQARGEK
jgi:tetratricopeptide (TPR) repeat protein